jgi:SAM-dependent methyltransferase
MHYRLLFCAACDLLYASPAPTPETLAAAYQAADYDSAAEAEYAADSYARLLRGFLGRLPDRDGALDIGAGDGAFLRRLLDCGFTGVAGVEPSAAPIAAATGGVRPLLRQGPLRRQDFTAGSFRLVTCFQTLEHVCDPLQLCRDAWALLKTGGAMLLVLHNHRAHSARLLGRRSPIYDVEHLQLFSRRSTRRLLAAAGFEEIRIQVLFNRYPLSYWMKLFPWPGMVKKAILDGCRRTGLGRLPVVLPAGNLAAVAFKRRV